MVRNTTVGIGVVVPEATPHVRWRAAVKRYIWRAAALLSAVLALLAFLPWAFPDAWLRGPLMAQIETRTGLVTEHLGRATITFLPVPRLTFGQIKIRDKSGGWVVEAPSVAGDLRLASLLTGTLELKSLTLQQPRIAVDLDAQPFGQASAIARALHLPVGSPDAAEAGSTRLGTLTIAAGTMHLKSRVRKFQTTLQNIDATLDWPRVGRPAVLEGSVIWRSHPARFDATASSLVAMLRGQPSQATLHLWSDLGEIEADGTISDAPRKQFTGQLNASTGSLRQIARLAGLTIPLPGSLDTASVEGDASLSGGKLWLSDAKVSLDGNAFQGSLAVYAGAGRTAISGTLAADQLNLDGVVASLPAVRTAFGGWSHEPLDIAGLSQGDVDLRISAARTRLGGIQVEDAALSLLLKSGRLEVSLAEARAYGGNVKMRAVGTLEPPNMDLKMSVAFSDVDLAAFGVAAFGDTWLAGVGTGQLTAQNVGDSPAAILGGLDGRGEIRIKQGELIGIDVEQALRRVEKRPLLSALEIRTGRTAFDSLSVGVNVTRGLARIADGNVLGPAARIAFGGTANVSDRTLDLKARATQTIADKPAATDGPTLILYVGGTWDAPRVEPDAASLIRRSGAAAPLFAPRRESNNRLAPSRARPMMSGAESQ